MKAIVAVNKTNSIGKDGKIPWHSSADFKHFKEKTKGAVCIVGQRTFELDLGAKPLPGRTIIVVGAFLDYFVSSDGVHFCPSLWSAVKNAILIQKEWEKDIWVIGGASIYNQLWPLITELHLSIINDDTEGDTKLEIPKDFRGTIVKYEFEPNEKGTE